MSEKESKSDDVIEIPFGKYVSSARKNPWIIASIVLALVLVVVLVWGKGNSGTGAIVSENEAGNNLVDFINAQGNGEASLVSSSREDSLYKVTVSYQGQEVPVYVTLDGKYLVPQTIPLSGSAGQGSDSSSASQEVVNLSIGDSPVVGAKNASVTVVEFSDFSCPYCAAASGDNKELGDYMKSSNPNWEPIVTNLMKDYVDTGKVKFAVKYAHGHSGGHPAQLVAWCLNEQNLYWKFYPKVFANQSNVEDLDKMKDLAKSVGADMSKLQACLDSKKYDSRFDKEQGEANSAGVSGTPAFFVNGKLVEGAVPYSSFKAIIEEELAAQ